MGRRERGSRKKFSQQAFGLGLALTVALGAADAQAWGHRGHQTVAINGSNIVPGYGAFWAANSTNMGNLTNVPDQKWKQSATAAGEKPTHFFQPDAYFPTVDQFDLFPRAYKDAVVKYTETTIVKNGTAPWRIKQFYGLALEALKKQDFATAVQMAGAMSHYIGDLSQPLHVTENYDGQQTKDPGIHKFFETDNLEAADPVALVDDVKAQALALIADPAFVAKFQGSLEDISFEEVNRAFVIKDAIIDADLKLGRTNPAGVAELLRIAKARMADGAATLALVLARLSKEAGMDPAVGATVNVTIPKWVAPSYLSLLDDVGEGPKSSVSPVEAFRAEQLADDCDQ